MAQINYVCPHCGSDQVQRFSVTFANGISDINTNTVGVGVGLTGNSGLGVGGAKTTGTSQTALSMSVAPPVKYGWGKELLKAFGILIISQLIIGLLFTDSTSVSGVLAWVVTILYLYFHSYKVCYNYNANIWPKEMEEWEHSWLCMKCGNRFIM